MEYPKRKQNRLPDYDYSQTGCYHVTICAKDNHNLFSIISPGNPFTPAEPKLTNSGIIVEKYIKGIDNTYSYITIDKYVIMPNHVHLLIAIHDHDKKHSARANEIIPFLVSTLKRLSNKEAGIAMWQRGYFDHVIRNTPDYLTVWQYIDDNPAKWIYDDYYIRG